MKLDCLVRTTFLILRVVCSLSAALSCAALWSEDESVWILAAAFQLVLVKSLQIRGVKTFFFVVEIA